MKFSCEKALLSAATATAGRAVASKTSIPALEGILIEAEETLRLTGYNLETGIRTAIPADIISPGARVVSARLFGDILRKLPDDIVSCTCEEHMMHITCGLSEFHIMTTPAEDFPELPSVEGEHEFTIIQSQLKSMIGQTLFAVSTQDVRPIHTGSLFEVEQGELTVVSLDGYRMALRREPIDTQTDEAAFSFVVPGAALGEVEKICTDTDRTITITQGMRHVLFQVEDTMLISRRLEGEFLNYRLSIPRQNAIIVHSEKRALITSIDRVSLILSDALKSPLRCTFGTNVVTLKTKASIGEASDQCAVEGEGGGLEIGFDNRYLIEALKAAPADRVRIEFNTNVSPCVILPEEGPERFLYLVLPVRLKAGE